MSLLIISTFLKINTLRINTNLARDYGSYISNRCYSNLLNQDYLFHTSYNTSNFISLSTIKIQSLIRLVDDLLSLLTSLLISFGITTALLIIDPYISLVSVFVLGSFYLIIVFINKAKLKKNSYVISNNSTEIVKTIQEGLGSIRDLIIGNYFQSYYERYTAHLSTTY